MNDKNEQRSPLAIARDEWLESEVGARCLDGGILQFRAAQQYLKNRLEIAFLAGAKAQEKIDE